MREFSVPAIVEIPATGDLTDPVWRNADEHPATPQFSVRGSGGWRDVTCAEFRDEVCGLARGFIAAGVEPGDRVALMSRTRYEWTLTDYAIWAVGAVTVPIYPTSSPDQVEWILGDSGVEACVVETDAHRAIVDSAGGRSRRVWLIDGGDLDGVRAEGSTVPPIEVDRRRNGLRADDIATIIYTSGTTGRPKGCMLTHRNIATDVGNIVPCLPNLFRPGAATLLFLPLAHSFARLLQVGVVQTRVRMGFSPDARTLMDDLAEFQPTFLLAVPRVFEKIHNSAKQRAHADGHGAIFDRAEKAAVAFSESMGRPAGPGPARRLTHAVFDRLVYQRLRTALGGRCTAAVSGGAPLGARLGHFFRGIGVTTYEGYGLTETSPAISANIADYIRVGTVGRPLPGVSVRIAADGEILVRGDIVFAGYWNSPDATATMIDQDGWLHTGDLGHLDEDGFLVVTGRTKEIIVTAGGKNVAPTVLEDQIRASMLVSQCLVVGDRMPFIAALITIDPDGFTAWKAAHGRPGEASVADLRDDPELRAAVQVTIDEANTSVSQAESIRAFTILTDDFTEANGLLTPSLKVKRGEATHALAVEISAIYGGQAPPRSTGPPR